MASNSYVYTGINICLVLRKLFEHEADNICRAQRKLFERKAECSNISWGTRQVLMQWNKHV